MTLIDLAPEAVAWQRKLRERRMLESPRQPAASLNGYAVETIGRVSAAAIINEYEWLGTLRGSYFVGLFSPIRELEGVVCFGSGTQGPIHQVIGSPVLCLERGACVHWAPRNAASFLITRACKLVHRLSGVDIFYAYADPMAGEYGAVYQACNWLYLGQGIKNDRRLGEIERKERLFVLQPGKDPDDASNWQTTRIFRGHNGVRPKIDTFRKAREAGWQIAYRGAKYVYATHLGRNRQKWRKTLTLRLKLDERPYPAPRPHLKRAQNSTA